MGKKTKYITPPRERNYLKGTITTLKGDEERPTMTESSTIKFNGKFPLKGNLNRNIQQNAYLNGVIGRVKNSRQLQNLTI